nr:immunoglobulin light chain junction region [Macaca mulatta]MOW16506.1 immunoglobulin light chain junction region [Macaca mulatta]MOW18300.1 immunoglobulin light chain junction region [Macaca mulatta]
DYYCVAWDNILSSPLF